MLTEISMMAHAEAKQEDAERKIKQTDDHPWDQLYYCCKDEPAEEVERFLNDLRQRLSPAEVADLINTIGGTANGSTLLHLCVKKKVRDKGVIGLLVRFGALQGEKEENGDTPLHIAAYIGDEECITHLLFSEHDNYSNCRAEGIQCTCGQQVMLQKRNIHGRLPKDEAKLSRSSAERLLNEAEILYHARDGKSPKFIYELIESKKEGVHVPKGFYVKLIKQCINLMYNRLIGICVLRLLKHKDFKESINACLEETTQGSKQYFLLLSFLHIADQNVEFFRVGVGNDPRRITDLGIARSENEVRQLGEMFKSKGIVACLVLAAIQLDVDEIVVELLKLLYNKDKFVLNWDSLSLPKIENMWLKELNNDEVKLLYLSRNNLKYLPKFHVDEVLVNTRIAPEIPNKKVFQNLTRLDVSHNKLRTVDLELFNLKYLRILDLSHNLLRRLPLHIVWSDKLNSLYLQNNELNRLPKSLALSCVAMLDLSYNKFEYLPECVCNMLMLRHLCLSGNKGILSFPNEMGKMRLGVWIQLEDMEQLIHPANLLENGTKQLIRHLRRKLYPTEENRMMNLMVVGPWHSGKSALINHFFKRERLPQETKGIVFDDILTFHSGFHKFKLQVVDFAGEIEYSTNQCFLTKRSLYLLVWDIRKDMEHLKEWLNCLVTYVPGVHVMVVATHYNAVDTLEGIEGRKLALQEWLRSNPRFADLCFGAYRVNNYRQKEFLFGKHWFHAVDCTFPPRGVKKLKKNIFKVAVTVRHAESKEALLGEKLPSFYIKVAQRIEVKCDQSRSIRRAHAEPPILEYDELLRMIHEEQHSVSCCCRKNQNGVVVSSADERDLNDAVEYLHDTGRLLHFKKNASLKNMYFIDIKWFQDILLALQDGGRSGVNDGHLEISEIKTIINSIKPNYPFNNVYIKFLEMYHIGFKTSKDTMQIAYYMKKDPQYGIREFKVKPQAKYERLHTMDYVPFGFWVKLISQILYCLDRMLLDADDLVYNDHKEWTIPNLHHLLSDKVEYWKKGLMYADQQNKVFISVSQIDVENSKYRACEELKGKAVIETKVITDNWTKSAQLLTDTIDHIRTVIVEWHNALTGPSSSLAQFAPCVTCLAGGKDQPKLFPIDECLKEFLMNDLAVEKDFYCSKHTFNSHITSSRLFPEFMFKGHPKLVLRRCHTIDYHLTEDVPFGGGGKVFIGTMTSHKRCGRQQMKKYTVAVKRLFFDVDDVDRVARFFDFRKEVLMLNDATVHPNIVSFYGVRFGKKLEMIMEYAEHGALTSILKKPLSRVFLYRVAYQVIDAIAFLHRCGMLYRDLKPDNILVFSDKSEDEINVKIGDFGTANYMAPRGMAAITGTPRYLAPEILLEKSDYTEAVDIWCYSLVIYELIAKVQPFDGFDNKDVVGRLRQRRRPEFKERGENAQCLKVLTEECWQHSPSNRPEALQVFNVLESSLFQLLMGSIQHKSVNVKHCISYDCNSTDLLCMDATQFSDLDLKKKKSGNPINLLHIRSVDGPTGEITAFSDMNEVLSFAYIDETHVVVLISMKSSDQVKLGIMRLSGSVAQNKEESVHRFVVLEGIMSRVTWTRTFDRKLYKIVSNNHTSILCFDYHLELITDFHDGGYCSEPQQLPEIDPGFTDVILLGDILGICYRGRVCLVKLFPNGLITPKCEILCERRIGKVLICKNHLLLTYYEMPEFELVAYDDEATPVEVTERFHYNMYTSGGLKKNEQVTTFCFVNHMFWMGTSCGTMLLFQNHARHGFILLQKMRPYTDEFIYMIGKVIDQKPMVVTYAKKLNRGAFYYDGQHNHCFKFHRAFLGYGKKDNDDAEDLFLYWHAPSVKELGQYPVRKSEQRRRRMSAVVDDLTIECGDLINCYEGLKTFKRKRGKIC